MNIERLREDILVAMQCFHLHPCADLLNRCYVALGEQHVQEPIGEIYDMDGVHMAVWVNGTPDVGTKLYAAPSPVQQEHEGPDYGDGPEFEGWAERSGQQSVPEGCVLVPVGLLKHIDSAMMAEGMAPDEELRAILAAPSAPAMVQGVNQLLLMALENTATWIEQLPVPTVGAAGQLVKIDKAIAAAQEQAK